MNATDIIPPSRLIKTAATIAVKLADLAGLRGPLTWWLKQDSDRNDPPVNYRRKARAVRELAKLWGVAAFPVLLNEREFCPTCDADVLMFVHPDNVCVHCWVGSRGLCISFDN